MHDIPIIAFFNNQGGVGKTSLVYHLSWMYTELGLRIVAADLDPQANLTTAFLDEDRLEELWPPGEHPDTLFGCIQPLMRGTGDIGQPHLEQVEYGAQQPPLFGSSLALLVGDLLLSGFEEDLSDVWPNCFDNNERSFRVISAFWHILQKAATEHNADMVLVDLGSNLGAINRAALIAADFVAVPLSPDIFSLQSLRNIGPILRKWRGEWKNRLTRNTIGDLSLPQGKMQPIGYIVLQHAIRMDRPVKAYGRWMARIPEAYRGYVLQEPTSGSPTVSNDFYCLALIKHYRSLISMAQDAHKPIFALKPADGAIGSHIRAVQGAFIDFRGLAQEIARKVHVAL